MKHYVGLLTGIGLAALAGGCATSSAVVQYGGVERQVSVPAQTAPCESAGIELLREGELVVPADASPAFNSTASRRTLDSVAIVYDVTRDGRAANIRYGGSSSDFNSDARRALIRAMADQVGTFEYAWRGEPSHAVACRYALSLETL